eukprot:snap_masked-scaffold_9-processed-gene-11.30-mRNA-1 protein AED:1.00 eAED:1.00 QI:0/0/0/0/1/1/2/0/340
MNEVMQTVFPLWIALKNTSQSEFLLQSLGTELLHQDESTLQETKGTFSWIAYIQLGILLLFINWSHRASIKPWARKIFNSLSKGSKIPACTIFKFCQAQSEFLWYTTFSLLGLKLLFFRTKHLSWLESPSTWWAGEPNFNLAIETPDLYAFYTLYSVRYAQQFVSVFLEPRRKDFVEMQVHHISTALLTVLTLKIGYLKVGLVVMVLMDLADPFLHLDYTQEKTMRKIMGIFADVCFGLFVLCFIITRIIGYSYVVITGFAIHFQMKMNDGEKFDIWKVLPRIEILETVCLFLLLVLLILQFFWFYEIIKLVIKVLKGEEVDDSRSEVDEEDTNKKIKQL